jgi:O-antigen ligase
VARLELLPQLAKVVDLPVEDEPQRAVLVRHGLARRLAEIDDRKASVAERNGPIDVKAFPIRPTVGQPLRHGLGRVPRHRRVAREIAADATHRCAKDSVMPPAPLPWRPTLGGRTLHLMGAQTATIPSGSRAALVVLVALVVLSPWPFGSALPITRWLITLICLVTSLGIALFRLWRREGIEVPLPALLAISIFLLGFAQLIPVPIGLHAFLAPGSATIWHPAVPAAADVLGSGPRPVSIWPEATRRAIGIGVGLIVLAVLAVPALRDRRVALRAGVVVVSSGIAVAVYGLIARLAFGDKLYGVFAVPTVAPFGPFVSKNHFAGYVELAALLALGLAAGLADDARRAPGLLGWAESRQAPRVVLAYGAFGLLSLAVLVSLSRGGAVSLAAGLVAFVLLRPGHQEASGLWRRRGLGALVVGVAALAALAVLPSEARHRLRTIGRGERDLSTAYRTVVWHDSLVLVASSPVVGHGLGAFVDALPRFKTGAGDVRVEHAENDYIELLAEGGAVGLILLLGVGGTLVLSQQATPSSAAYQGARPRRALYTGAAAGLVALAVHSLVDFNVRIPSNACLVALLAAWVLSQRAPSRHRATGALALAAVCTAGLLAVLRPPTLTRPEGFRGAEALGGQKDVPALRVRAVGDELMRHLSNRPADSVAWAWLGWARASAGRTVEGAALARYAADLNPSRKGLQELAPQSRDREGHLGGPGEGR